MIALAFITFIVLAGLAGLGAEKLFKFLEKFRLPEF